MENSEDYVEINRANWDARVPIHLQGYDLDSFRGDPGFISKVVRFDLIWLPKVKGLQGIHLQCHIGTDTLSLSRLGADMVGLDFSPAAVSEARNLASELNSSARFIESEVYTATASLAAAGMPTQYDFVFTGIGALCWLPDIQRWAATVSSLLRAGGFLFIREGHPMLWSLGDSRADGVIEVCYDYFEGTGITFIESETYEGEGAVQSPSSISFNHGLAEIMNALRSHRLTLELFVEHNSVPWNPMGHEFEPVGDTGEWRLRVNPQRLAASYTMIARRA
jgi:SAM-dependent methyltransferase